MKRMKNKRIFILFTLIAMIFSGFASLNYSHSAPQAGIFCNSIGSFMQQESVDTNNVVNPDSENRKWTVQEVFENSVKFTTYHGEGEETWLQDAKVDRGRDRVGESAWNASGVQDRLKGARSNVCLSGDIFSNGILYFSGGIVKLINSTISSFIGNDGMTDGLATIIAGETSEDSGLIGTFVNSLYMPLVVIAFLFAAVTIVYKGLIQMKFREAIMSAIWSLGAFVIGLALMFNPSMLVGFPQAATTTITSCIMGAMSGQNCLTDDVVAPALVSGNECRSEFVGGDNDVEGVINSMNCTIWKSFVLELWAEQQFGEPYADLYTYNVPEGGNVWSSLPEGKEELYCVNLASRKAASDRSFRPYRVQMDLDSNSTVCNVALYQLYLKTEMVDTVNHEGDGYRLVNAGETPEPIDVRWFDIIVPMTSSHTNWANWSGQGRTLGRMMTSLFSLFSVVMVSVILLTLSVFGAAYKVISVVMMAFAPMFFLLAIEPTRGRKIFLGWLETLVSSLLKYFAVTLLMVISLMLYAGILSNTTGFASFISVIILTVALWMYRKEIVDLIGASNMGGQRVSNKTNELLDKAKKETKQKGAALAGGAVGGSIATQMARRKNLSNRNDHLESLGEQLRNADSPEEAKELQDKIDKEKEAIGELGTSLSAAVKGAGSGAKESGMRVMKRGTSASAMAFKQLDATKLSIEKIQKDELEKAKYERESDPEQNGDNAGQETKGNPNGKGPDNNGPRPNIPGAGDMTPAQLAKFEGIDAQRENVEYTGELSDKEINSLDKFAEQIQTMTDDSSVVDLSKDEEIMADDNKRRLVANEINARLRYNTLNGEISGELSRHELADLGNISNEELKLNMDIYRENYLETGSESEYQKFEDASKELVSRGGVPVAEVMRIKSTRRDRAIIEETDNPHVRDESIPTLEEANSNPENYIEGKVKAPKGLDRKVVKDESDVNTKDKPTDESNPTPKDGKETSERKVELNDRKVDTPDVDDSEERKPEITERNDKQEKPSPSETRGPEVRRTGEETKENDTKKPEPQNEKPSPTETGGPEIRRVNREEVDNSEKSSDDKSNTTEKSETNDDPARKLDENNRRKESGDRERTPNEPNERQDKDVNPRQTSERQPENVDNSERTNESPVRNERKQDSENDNSQERNNSKEELRRAEVERKLRDERNNKDQPYRDDNPKPERVNPNERTNRDSQETPAPNESITDRTERKSTNDRTEGEPKVNRDNRDNSGNDSRTQDDSRRNDSERTQDNNSKPRSPQENTDTSRRADDRNNAESELRRSADERKVRDERDRRREREENSRKQSKERDNGSENTQKYEQDARDNNSNDVRQPEREEPKPKDRKQSDRKQSTEDRRKERNTKDTESNDTKKFERNNSEDNSPNEVNDRNSQEPQDNNVNEQTSEKNLRDNIDDQIDLINNKETEINNDRSDNNDFLPPLD